MAIETRDAGSTEGIWIMHVALLQPTTTTRARVRSFVLPSRNRYSGRAMGR